MAQPVSTPQVGVYKYEGPPPKKLPPPITTVFVGNLPEGVENDSIVKLLEKCGNVMNWKRLTAGANGKPQKFGFCEYKQPEASLRCLRLLNGVMLGGNSLVVNIDEKTKGMLDVYMNVEDKEENEFSENASNESRIKGEMDVAIAELNKDLKASGFNNSPTQSDTNSRHSDRERRHDNERRRRSRSKERSRDRRSRSPTYGHCDRGRSRDRGDRAQSPTEKLDSDEEDARHEQRRQDRIKREQEDNYQRMLRDWQIREQKKAREYTKQKEKDEQQEKQVKQDALLLKRFLQDYIDDQDDHKYYTGRALEKRRAKRESELKMDARDRQKEKEEIEAVRKQLIDRGVADVDQQVEQLERANEEHLLPRLHLSQTNLIDQIKQSGVGHEAKDTVDLKIMRESQKNGGSQYSFAQPTDTQPSPAAPESPAPNDLSIEEKSGPVLGPQAKSTDPVVEEVFNADSPGDEAKRPPPRPLTPPRPTLLPVLPDNATTDMKRKTIKMLIEKIPTDKADLFSFDIDWEALDTTLLEQRIRPWVDRKIVEYIGQKEQSLTDFIVGKVKGHSPPDGILTDVAVVLDDEATVFVSKLWRLIIYETEAKKIGLSSK